MRAPLFLTNLRIEIGAVFGDKGCTRFVAPRLDLSLYRITLRGNNTSLFGINNDSKREGEN